MTVSGYSGTTTLTDFPLLVRISPTLISGFAYADCAANGADISFTTEDGTVLPHEVDTWDTAGESLVWVKVPSISGTETKFKFRWYDPVPAVNDPTEVWSEYAGVWHLGETDAATDTNAVDSTGHGFTAAIPNKSETELCATKAAKIGNGRWKPKTTMTVPSYDSQNAGGTFTASGWFYMDERTAYESFFNRKQAWDTGTGWQSNMQNDNKNFFCSGSGNKNQVKSFSTSVVGRWINYAIVFNGTSMQPYDNGTAVSGGAVSINAAGDNERPLYVGGSIKGTIDEIRIRKAASSADWVKAEYEQVTKANYVTAGEAEIASTTVIAIRSSLSLKYGAVNPAYGVIVEPVDGQEYTFICTKSEEILVENEKKAICTGWKLYRLSDGALLKSSADSGEKPLECTYSYNGVGVNLEWQWKEQQHKVTVSADVGGSVSVDQYWTDIDGRTTITATPADGYRFSHWSGDVTDVAILQSTATVPGDRNRTLVAHFISDETETPVNTYSGASSGFWNVDGNWSLGHMPTAEENVVIPSGKGTVSISNAAVCASLKIVNDVTLKLNGYGYPTDDQIRLDVRGDVISTGHLTLGNSSSHRFDVLFNAGGNVCFSNDNRDVYFTVYAGDSYGTNTAAVIAAGYRGDTAAPRLAAYQRGGAQVNVGGKLILGGKNSGKWSYLKPYAHYTTGKAVVFRVGDFVATSRAQVYGSANETSDSANYYGWHSCNSGYHGIGSGRQDSGGASYGGRGGCNTADNTSKAGLIYGYANAPIWPGSAQGRNGSDGGNGGGLFRLHATGDVKLDGYVYMNGSTWGSSEARGGGSGGGVWITCDTFTPGASAVIQANGGTMKYGAAGGGGGGRIAVATGCGNAADVDAFLTTGTNTSFKVCDFAKSSYPSLCKVNGGQNSNVTTWYPEKTYAFGSAGTAVFLQKVGAGQGSLTVTATPYRLGNANPSLVTHVVDEGDVVCTEDEIVYLEGSNERSRMHVAGGVWTNAVTHGSGTGATVTVPVNGDTTLIWQYNDLEHKLDVTSGGYGTVGSVDAWQDDGASVQIVATPAEGCTFVRWVGDISAADAKSATVTVTMDAPRRLVAVFDNPNAAARNLTCAGVADWFSASAWDGTAIPGTNDTVTVTASTVIPHADAVRVGNLVVSAGTLSFDLSVDKDACLEVVRDLTVADKATIKWGALARTSRADISVGGDLTLNGSGKIEIFAGEGVSVTTDDWQAFKRGGSSLVVGGDMTLNGTSSIVPHCAKASGLPVVMNVGGDATVEQSASIIAAQYVWVQSGDKYYHAYGWVVPNGLGIKSGYGGSHGGLGGNCTDTTKLYGWKYAPFYPGSPGNYTDKGWGGGVVRLAVKGNVTLNGQIVVTGGYNESTGHHAGSGGSVWITCAEFSAGASAKIYAEGGRSIQHSEAYPGGGGRVAIMVGSPMESQIDSLYETGTCDYLLVQAEDMTDASCAYAGLVSVKGGICNDKQSAATDSRHGQKGTAVLLKNSYGQAKVTVSGSVQTLLTDPQYGSQSVDLGEYTFTAPAFVYSEDGLSRYPCTGYEWADANGRSDSGSGRSFTIDVNSDTEVTWLWGTQEYFLDMRCSGYGTLSYDAQSPNEKGWYDSNTVVSVTCTPEDAQTTFDDWLGDIADADKMNAAISVLVDRPKVIVATFHRDAARARDIAWTGNGGDSDWFNKDNWDGFAAPGPSDRVTIASGTVQVKYPCDLAVASLALSGSTKLYVGCKTSTTYYGGLYQYTYYTTVPDSTDTRDSSLTVGGDLSMSGTAQAYFGGIEQKGRMDLTVNGNLTMNGSSSSSYAWMQVYAGKREDWTNLDNYITGGGSLKVKGNITLDGYSRLTPCCDRYTGAIVPITADWVTIGVNSVLEANMRGFGRSYVNPGSGWTMTMYGYCKTGSTVSFGGTYGGQGGYNSTASFGYLAAPFYPGGTGCSPAEGYTSKILSGGGAVRLDARRVVLKGKITSNTHGEYRVGAGAGGGIWITTRKFILGEKGAVQAYHTDGSDYSNTGGGGGGRISICLKFTPEHIAKMYQCGEVREMTVTNLADLPEWTGHYNVSGGKGPSDGRDGTAGTAVLVKAPPTGLMVIVK